MPVSKKPRKPKQSKAPRHEQLNKLLLSKASAAGKHLDKRERINLQTASSQIMAVLQEDRKQWTKKT